MDALLRRSGIAGLIRARRAAILPLLAILPACSPQPESSPAPAPNRGAQIYAASCIACHQSDGHGIAHVYPSLAGSAVVAGDPAALTRWVIKGERPEGMPAGRYSGVMPQYSWLKDEDAAALFSHLRSSFGNRASAVSAGTIARARGVE